MKTVIVFVVVLFNLGLAQLTTFEKNAQSFEVVGLKIGDRLTKFLEMYPTAERSKDDSDTIGAVTYGVDGLGAAATLGGFFFFDNKLYGVGIYYPQENISKQGGYEEFLDRLIKKIGKYNKLNTDEDKHGIFVEAVWNFKKIHRYFKMKVYAKGYKDILLVIKDLAVQDIVTKRKESVNDFGF